MNKTIVFDNLNIKYDVSISYDKTKSSVPINIFFPHSFALKNEQRLKALEQAILQGNSSEIHAISHFVAKNGDANIYIECTFQEAISFETLTVGNQNASFFFNKGIELNLDTQVHIESQDSSVEEHIRQGHPFGVIGRGNI